MSSPADPIAWPMRFNYMNCVPAPCAGVLRGIAIDVALQSVPEFAVSNEKTATLPAGVYFDALQVRFGDIVSPLWVGQILVAANPFGV